MAQAVNNWNYKQGQKSQPSAASAPVAAGIDVGAAEGCDLLIGCNKKGLPKEASFCHAA
ncbi:hypothetical protein [Pseudomonas fluorescens]|uniref:hypothetical protein n=1 Tax=Pseudomonas fluorescens TaxID=294 RepID=UPI0015585EF9|nr:hypothetical protein [Pseudomonas fluorescens]